MDLKNNILKEGTKVTIQGAPTLLTISYYNLREDTYVSREIGSSGEPWTFKEKDILGIIDPQKLVKDNVNHPSHYTNGSIEVIDFIEDQLTEEEFRGYIKGNVLKYTAREKLKGKDEDLKKANWYLRRLLDAIEAEGGDVY